MIAPRSSQATPIFRSCVMLMLLLVLRLPAGENLVQNGEMTDGAPPLGFKLEDTPLAAVEVVKGNPLPGDTSLKGPSCLKFTFRQSNPNSKGFRINQKLILDPAKSYRFSAKLYVPDDLLVRLSGNGHNPLKPGKNGIEKDGQMWAWGCGGKGPSGEWKTVECAIPSAKSGEKGAMPADLEWIDLLIAISARSPGVAYLGDITLEETK